MGHRRWLASKRCTCAIGDTWILHDYNFSSLRSFGDMRLQLQFPSFDTLLAHFVQQQRMMVYLTDTASKSLTWQFAPHPTATNTSTTQTMNTHTRFALPMNTHGNLKYLHDKTQANVDSTSTKAVKQAPEAIASKPLRHSSNAKFAQKMKMLFPTKKAKSQASDEECEATVNERKRSTMAQLVGSHAVVQMGRR